MPSGILTFFCPVVPRIATDRVLAGFTLLTESDDPVVVASPDASIPVDPRCGGQRVGPIKVNRGVISVGGQGPTTEPKSGTVALGGAAIRP